MKIPSYFSAGPWHFGEKVDIRIHTSGVDTYPNNYVCAVEVKEKETGKISIRRGAGKFIGNFSPVWINWKGKSLQLTELLREK